LYAVGLGSDNICLRASRYCTVDTVSTKYLPPGLLKPRRGTAVVHSVSRGPKSTTGFQPLFTGLTGNDRGRRHHQKHRPGATASSWGQRFFTATSQNHDYSTQASTNCLRYATVFNNRLPPPHELLGIPISIEMGTSLGVYGSRGPYGKY